METDQVPISVFQRISRIAFTLVLMFQSLVYAQNAVVPQTRVTIIRPELHNSKIRFPNLLSRGTVQRPRVALVLSGGGARGIAAIGVLRVLEQNKIPIDLIVGTSIGSIIGGLYAMGYSTEQLQQIVDTTNWDELLSMTDEARRRDMFLDQKTTRDKSIIVLRFIDLKPVIPKAFSTGQRLTNYLNILTLQGLYHPDPSFDDLRIPFRVVTTDLVTGRRIVIDRGDITEALRASFAIPLLFSAVPRDSMQLLDGGLVDNLPVDVAIAEHADIVVAVDVASPLRPKSKLNAPWEIADQITAIMMQESNRLAREKADIVITPKLGDHLATDFSDLDSSIAIGESAAKESLPALKMLIEKRTLQKYSVDTMLYKRPRFSGMSDLLSEYQDSFRAFEKRGWITQMELQRMVNEIYDEGNSVAVEGEVKERTDSTYIDVHITPSPILHDIKIIGNRVIASDTLLGVVHPLVGRRLNTDSISGSIEHLLAVYRNAGHSLARVTDIQFDTVSNTATISIDEGIVYRIDINGTIKTRDWVIWRELPWQESDIFSISKVAQGISNLYGTSLFEQILVSTHHEGSRKELNVATIKAQERGTELIRLGLRVDDERDIQPSIDIRDENLLGTGAEIGVMAGGGTRNQSYIGEIKTTRFFNSYLTLGLKGYSIIRDINVYGYIPSTDPYSFERDRIGEYRKVRSGALVTFGFQLERLGSVTVKGRLEKIHLYNIFNSLIENKEYNISSIRFGTNLDTQDKLPYPTDGVVIDFYYESALVKFIDAVGFTKMYFSYDKYQTIIKNHTIHPRFVIGVADETLPMSEFFSLGGQQNFFGYHEDDSRGRQLLTASLEYQYKLPFSIFFDTYFKARYDFGSIWARAEEMRLKDFKHAIGVTIGLDTPIGPAEFSIGRAFYFNTLLSDNPLSFGPFYAYFCIGFPIAGSQSL